MTVSLFSRFQGCLLLTFLATGDGEPVNNSDLINSLESWSRIFHPGPYQGALPEAAWLGAQLRWSSQTDFYRWLVVLALWHHENPAGFATDLGRSVAQFNHQWGDRPLSVLDQAWLNLWQRLLTGILSERFTVAQWPDRWQSLKASLGDGWDLEPPSTLAQGIPRAIEHWGATPTQPRLSLRRCQGDRPTAPFLSFTAALSGAYHGETISREAIAPLSPAQTHLGALVNDFAQRHFLGWSGGLSSPSSFSASTGAAPLVIQRRSGLKLISQRDYGQFL